jgi:hypothetical protein
LARLSIPATLAALVLLLSSASAHASHVQCGDVITQDTTLDSDLIDCPGNGITVAASDVSLDLNGHVVAGVGNGAGISVDVQAPGVFAGLEVSNGTVAEFLVGVNLEDVADPTVRELTVAKNGATGISGNRSGGVLIVGSAVRENGGSAVVVANVEIGTRPDRVEGSSLVRNAGTGVLISFGGQIS